MTPLRAWIPVAGAVLALSCGLIPYILRGAAFWVTATDRAWDVPLAETRGLGRFTAPCLLAAVTDKSTAKKIRKQGNEQPEHNAPSLALS